jgi:uncharacterized protein (TIGR01619 family)
MPWLLWIWVYFQSPRPDGLSDSAEAGTLYSIEDALSTQLEKSCGSVVAGRITTCGRREFYFYGATSDRFEAAVAQTLAAFPTYKYDLGHQLEADWNQYLNVLYPSPNDLEKIKNGEVLANLKKLGDVHSIPRPVMHWIFFASQVKRSEFCVAVELQGFTVEEQYSVEGDFPLAVRLTRFQSVEVPRIDEAVLTLRSIAERFGGDYDGWETQVTTAEEA